MRPDELVSRLRQDAPFMEPSDAARIALHLQQAVSDHPAAWASVADCARRNGKRHGDEADRLFRLAALVEAALNECGVG